jgi:hypothetical protein
MRFAFLLVASLIFIAPVAGCAAPTISTITLAAYDRVQVGMTYEEVVAAMGKEGKELSKQEFDGVVTAQYRWENGDGTNMIGQFRGGKLVSKSQSGLK